MTRHAPRRPRGFTLIELLVVLVIIAILVGLLVPAIAMAVKKAKGAAIQAEINQLAQALADFKSKYGDYPPSRVLLNEGGFLNTTDPLPISSGATADVTYGQLAQRSITALRKFWPRVGMLSALVPGNNPPYFYDFNGNGNNDYDQLGRNFLLQGHECLVFFLGGIPVRDATGAVTGMGGFSKNPQNPFQNSIQTSNRTAPMFEFNSGRLKVVSAHGIPGYIDQFNGLGNNQSFYAYFSNNLNTGYDPNDVNFTGNLTENDGSGKPIGLYFNTGFPVYSAPNTPQANPTLSPAPNPYTGSAPAYQNVPTSPPPVLISNVTCQNGQSFQIISPGSDGMYGAGGIYTATATGGGSLPAEDANAASYPNSTNTDTGLRNGERDNLTNFHNGTLD
jgi:prepilin-type N-terminal cleavage/methylation domain-containing protein